MMGSLTQGQQIERCSVQRSGTSSTKIVTASVGRRSGEHSATPNHTGRRTSEAKRDSWCEFYNHVIHREEEEEERKKERRDCICPTPMPRWDDPNERKPAASNDGPPNKRLATEQAFLILFIISIRERTGGSLAGQRTSRGWNASGFRTTASMPPSR